MTIQFPYKGRIVTATDDVLTYFSKSENKDRLFSAYDIAENCLDCTYSVIHPHYPKTVKPNLFIADDEDINALSDSKENRIVIFSGLVERITELIESRYSDERIAKYNLIPEYSPKVVRSIIGSYVWRFVLLHELYHNWHSHVKWSSMYYFDITGKLCKRPGSSTVVESIMYEKPEMLTLTISDIYKQQRITSQAKEFDADSITGDGST